MTDVAPTITVDTLIAQLDETLAEFNAILDQLEPVFNTPSSPAGWSPRQVLSHVIGTWQRIPFQAAYFLTDAKDIPVVYHDPFWITEYTNAPLPAFRASLLAAAEGIKGFLRNLPEGGLYSTITLPDWGAAPMVAYLTNNLQNHVHKLHIPQLRSFLPK